MAAILDPKVKQTSIPFIKANFGRISQREIARKLEIGKTTVNRWCRELNLIYKKHTVNENFFDKWNETMSYILGYIFTDGNVAWNESKSYWSLTITTAEKDKEHLEKMREIILSTKPLLYSEKTKSFRLIAVNKKLCQKLMKLGVVPKKSLIVKFPQVPKRYLRHFIRGVIDGDGTVRYVDRKRSPYFVIQIVSGSRKFLYKLAHNIKNEITICAKVRKYSGHCFVVSYTCTRGKKLAEWIYKDTDLFLVRKFEKYMIMKNMEVVVPD